MKYFTELQKLEREADRLMGDTATEARNKLQRCREFIIKTLNQEEDGKPITVAQDQRITEMLDDSFTFIHSPKSDQEVLKGVRNELLKMAL